MPIPLSGIGKHTLKFWKPLRFRELKMGFESPVGCQAGRGGWLEYTPQNLDQFRCYFQPYLPPNVMAADLTVSSTDFTHLHPDYHLLPPRDLWPNLVPTLALLRYLMAVSGVSFQIHSVYRSSFVNSHSGGAAASAHMDCSGIDITPNTQPQKAIWLAKHIWYQKGASIKMGLGFYTSTRFHIDARAPHHPQKRRWGWGQSASVCQHHYNQHFSATLPDDIWPFNDNAALVPTPDESCGYSPSC